MTIQVLKEIIENLPDNMEVMVKGCCGEFPYNPVSTLYVKEIGFSEDPGGEILAEEDVFVISEE